MAHQDRLESAELVEMAVTEASMASLGFTAQRVIQEPLQSLVFQASLGPMDLMEHLVSPV